MKGKSFSRTCRGVWKKVHFKKNAKRPEGTTWNEGHFLGFHWRTSESIIGTKDGIHRAGTIRRVGSHRCWDATALVAIRGVTWKWAPEADDVVDKLVVRHLTDEEKKNMVDPVVDTGSQTVCCMRLESDMRCAWFAGPFSGVVQFGCFQKHVPDECRNFSRTEVKGKNKTKDKMNREHEYYSHVLQAEEQARKKQKLHTSGGPEGVSVERGSTKRSQEQS